ncbi:sensor histidine kinase [Cellvibrio polysaccharolyticus]|uniref:histidine kinase n=1 Tax=Cellvibrio polysaccharolyticus TaxID=2082724 RepID=A0A928V7X0_9GAMM|nr:ATP-binding protein [Cellvibrio polysaccharolyticus]MBE8717709.1 hypothetical protein [Cellvibrio polysaccharolyticus]
MMRLIAGLIVASVLSLFLLGFFIDRIADDGTPTQTEQLGGRLVDYLANQSDSLSEGQLSAHYQKQSEALGLTLFLEPFHALALPPELMQQLAEPGGLALATAEQHYLVRQLPSHPQWLIKLALPDGEDQHPLGLWLTLVLYAGLALLLLLWLWPLLSRLLLLTRVAELFGRGEHETRMAPSRFSYIPTLENSFNRMAEQISQLLHENRLLAKSMSHDLRTPIACLRFGLDALQESEDAQQTRRLAERMEQDVNRMEAMVNSFLEYASLSRTALTLTFQPLALNSWIANYRETIAPLLLQHQLTLSIDVPDAPIRAAINPLWFERALSNIVVNACRYARTRVQIRIGREDQQVFIDISDDGSGIADADLERILQPFVRLDAPGASAEPHFGLGLAIVVEVMKWHEGRVAVTRCAALGGARFRLVLPALDR